MTLRAKALLLVLLVVASGCDRGRDSKEGEDAGPPRRGGVLRVGVVRPATLDPARARTVDEMLIADQLFDSLTASDPETLEPVPSLAASWEGTPDQLHWAFTIRPGAMFGNGRPVTGTDVKYTFDRIVQKGSTSSVADLLEVVVGFRSVNVDGTATELAGVTLLSDSVVKIDLDQPLADLPSLLSNPAFGVVPREAAEAEDPPFAERPVGSGPFQIESRTPTTISLRPSAGTETFVAGIELSVFDDKDASYRAFVDGDLDWSEVPADGVAEARRKYGADAFRPYLAVLFYGFNLRNSKFADLRFREAIVRAVDRQGIVGAVYDDTVRPAANLVVEGVPGHQQAPCGERCEHDARRAKGLVGEVFGESQVHEIGIDYDDDVTQTAVAKAIQADLAEVGISSVLRPKSLAEYQEFAVSGNQELFRLGWIGAYPSPDAFLPPLFLTGVPSNLTGFSSEAVDQQLRAARAEPDRARRIELFQAAERAILEQVVILPIAQFEVQSVVSERVRGLRMMTTGTFDPTAVWLTSGA